MENSSIQNHFLLIIIEKLGLKTETNHELNIMKMAVGVETMINALTVH